MDFRHSSEQAALWYSTPTHIPVLGHRGICARYPENTMPSFEAAIDLGVDLIEFDVNVTADGELVVIHDNDIQRTCDHAGLTRSYSLAELKTFDFSAKFNKAPGFKDVRIPTLREVLELVVARSSTLLLNVEIKDMHSETVDKTVAMLKEFGLCERSVIACFDAAILRYAHAQHPTMRLQGFPGRYMSNFTPETYTYMFGIGIPLREDLDEVRRDVKFAQEKGILPWLFVADTEETVKKCVDLGAANITGNDPLVALTTLRSLGLHA